MQAIRGIVIIVGLMVAIVGLYLLVIGLGAPIELPVIEVGQLRASASGIGAGAVVSGVGLAMMWLAMDKFKRSESMGSQPPSSHPTPSDSGSGGGDSYRHVVQDKIKDHL